MHALPSLLGMLGSVCGIERAYAQFTSFSVTGWGYGDRTWGDILGSVVTVFKGTVESLAVMVFIVGAFFFAISAGDEQRKSMGKDMMIYSLIGLAIVIGAEAILKTVAFFIWGN